MKLIDYKSKDIMQLDSPKEIVVVNVGTSNLLTLSNNIIPFLIFCNQFSCS